ncbi:MAG: RNA polymerase sigma factor [Oceanipulchritudo sp.]
MDTDNRQKQGVSFAQDSVVDLLDWIAQGNEQERDLACRELYQRHTGWLFNRLRTKDNIDDEEAADLALRALSVACKKSTEFERRTDEDLGVQEKRFRKWILAIAVNLWKTWLRKKPPIVTMDEMFWECVNEQASAPSAVPPPRAEVKIVEEVMNELSEREQHILRTYLYHCPDVTNKQAKLDRKIISELCERYQTTDVNIRAIRSRAMKKVKEKLAERGITQ